MTPEGPARSARSTRRRPLVVDFAAHRDSLGMTQADVAAQIHRLGWPVLVDPSTISNWESGRRRTPTAVLPLLASAVRVGHDAVRVDDTPDDEDDEEPDLAQAAGL